MQPTKLRPFNFIKIKKNFNLRIPFILCHTILIVVYKSPLTNKMLKNNAETRGQVGRCRRNGYG